MGMFGKKKKQLNPEWAAFAAEAQAAAAQSGVQGAKMPEVRGGRRAPHARPSRHSGALARKGGRMGGAGPRERAPLVRLREPAGAAFPCAFGSLPRAPGCGRRGTTRAAAPHAAPSQGAHAAIGAGE